mmetsp:Transcript_4148/g.9224  ORF Transcript_4148/g.9224 Transcript_4148/m.9224 type:complete len:91 (-) Transcript_4148:173-445(-)
MGVVAAAVASTFGAVAVVSAVVVAAMGAAADGAPSTWASSAVRLSDVVFGFGEDMSPIILVAGSCVGIYAAGAGESVQRMFSIGRKYHVA